MVRKFKSTGKTNKREAQTVADAIASAAVAKVARGHDRLDAHHLVRELLDSASVALHQNASTPGPLKSNCAGALRALLLSLPAFTKEVRDATVHVTSPDS